MIIDERTCEKLFCTSLGIDWHQMQEPIAELFFTTTQISFVLCTELAVK
jgi:hypothetical protein